MQTVRLRRTSWAIAASAVAHVAVLSAALLHQFILAPPIEEAGGPPEPVIPVLLLPRARGPSETGSRQFSAVSPHRWPKRLDDTAL